MYALLSGPSDLAGAAAGRAGVIPGSAACRLASRAKCQLARSSALKLIKADKEVGEPTRTSFRGKWLTRAKMPSPRIGPMTATTLFSDERAHRQPLVHRAGGLWTPAR